MNRSVLIGRLCADPNLSYSKKGTGVCKFTLAVDRPKFGDKKETDFIPIVCFGKLAENVAQYQKKGSQVGIDGRLQIDSYEKDGQKRTYAQVVADTVQFLDKKGE